MKTDFANRGMSSSRPVPVNRFAYVLTSMHVCVSSYTYLCVLDVFSAIYRFFHAGLSIDCLLYGKLVCKFDGTKNDLFD